MTGVTLSEEYLPRTAEDERSHLLVIDDDAGNRDFLCHLFESEYRTTGAASGPEGLEIIARENVDVVLLDIMMPQMSGFAVLEQVRSQPGSADLPIVLISGLTDNEHVVQGLQLGANDYLPKPINVHVARARIRTQMKLKRLLDEQKQTMAQMEQLSQVREHFFRIASHDLKNPLANLNLAVHELNLLVPRSKETAVIQDAIDITLEQMQSIIEDFLDVATLENATLELSVGYIDMGDCLQQILIQYSRAARRKRITLSLGDVEGVVIADRTRLMQIIGNLVSNAIKFSPEGTTVMLWTRASGNRVRIFVQDEGPGIPLDEQNRLFHEFVTGTSRPTGGESSTGLGLWIVSKLVHLLDGSVGLESTPGHGSVFWIDLPRFDLRAVQTITLDES